MVYFVEDLYTDRLTAVKFDLRLYCREIVFPKIDTDGDVIRVSYNIILDGKVQTPFVLKYMLIF